MNKESIIKLIMSKDSINIELAMNLLVGKSKEEIRQMFGLIHNNSHTILKGINLPTRLKCSFKISEDCILYTGYNFSIIKEPGKYHKHIDLTI